MAEQPVSSGQLWQQTLAQAAGAGALGAGALPLPWGTATQPAARSDAGQGMPRIGSVPQSWQGVEQPASSRTVKATSEPSVFDGGVSKVVHQRRALSGNDAATQLIATALQQQGFLPQTAMRGIGGIGAGFNQTAQEAAWQAAQAQPAALLQGLQAGAGRRAAEMAGGGGRGPVRFGLDAPSAAWPIMQPGESGQHGSAGSLSVPSASASPPGSLRANSIGAHGGASPLLSSGGDDGSAGKPLRQQRAPARGRRAAGGAGLSPNELATLPPQRVKRILANRDSAARSKERKLQYIAKLETQVNDLTLQLNGVSVQLRGLQADTNHLGDSNQALVHQALLLQEHLRQQEMETVVLLSELRHVQALTGQAAFGNRNAAGVQQQQPVPQQTSSLGGGGGGGIGGSEAINQLLYGPRGGPSNPTASSAASPVPRPVATFGMALASGPPPGFLSTGTPGVGSFARPSFNAQPPPSPHSQASPMATSTPMHSAADPQWAPQAAAVSAARPPFGAAQPGQTPRAGAGPSGPAAGGPAGQDQQPVASSPPAAAAHVPGSGPARGMERVTSAPPGQVGAVKPEAPASRTLHAAASVPARALNPDALDDIMSESSLFPDLHFFNVDHM